MNIVFVRRICQGFFLALFVWFCLVMNLGDRWWQLRGWPVNWFLQLDPLVGLGTLLTTRTLYSGLLWSVATVVLTIVLGRFFCGWVCPFGTLHHLVGRLGHRTAATAARTRMNRYHPWQSVKYLILTVLLAAAAADLAGDLFTLSGSRPVLFGWVVLAGVVLMAWMAWQKVVDRPVRAAVLLAAGILVWAAAGRLLPAGTLAAASLQTGLLDPIPLFHRSVNLVLLPLADSGPRLLSPQPRYFLGAGLIGAVFLAAVLLNLRVPRFYCRFVCPLGALFGVLGRFALWRVGKSHDECRHCHRCETFCEGACEPSAAIRTAECVLCMNCLDGCRHGLMGYRTAPSAAGEVPGPDLGRRGFVVSLVSGIAAVPALRVGGSLAAAWDPHLVRPPGALSEADFLDRCIKCGQCMRVCPTNVIQPAGPSMGLEALWTPRLDFRIGTSGCQLNCIACGHVCPTAAIRPIPLAEKLGTGPYADAGPVRIGTAFVDRGRCLPWAMDTPCIVCQENCPVSPKAITTRVVFAAVPTAALTVTAAEADRIELAAGALDPGRFGTGDYFVRVEGQDGPRPVLTNTGQTITIIGQSPFDRVPEPGARVDLLIRLQQPVVDPGRCIGCGVCQHECPVRGLRAIRVTADNETRGREHGMVL